MIPDRILAGLMGSRRSFHNTPLRRADAWRAVIEASCEAIGERARDEQGRPRRHRRYFHAVKVSRSLSS